VRSLGAWICLLLVVVILVSTNPSVEEYSKWFASHSVGDDSNPLMRGFAELITRPLVEYSTKTRDFVVLTLFETNIEQESTVVLGILNNFIVIRGPRSR